jgi:hypothetical protein
VVHDDAVIPEASRDVNEQPARYAVVPVHEPAVKHEHVEPPKLVLTVVVATHAAVVWSAHDAWPAPVVVVPVAH